MKYTIEGFSQAFAMTLKKEVAVGDKMVLRKVDCTDLVILRWFVDFYPNMKKIEVDGKQYAWLTHKKLLEDLPLIDISRKAFIERMQKLVDFEILTYKLVKEGGTFSLYGFGENYENLIKTERVADQTDTGCTNNNTEGGGSNVHGVAVQTDNKDNSIRDTSFSDTKESKKASFDSLIETYSRGNEKVKELLGEWLKVRKAKRAAMTDRAIELNLQKLDRLAKESKMSVADYLEEIIRRGWQAFYAIKTYGNDNKTYGRNGIAISNESSDLDDVF